MDVEKTSDTQAAWALAQRKKELVEQENALIREKGRVQQDGLKELASAREKIENDKVQISKEAGAQMDTLKKINTERIHALNENTQKHFEKLSETVSEEVKRLSTDADKTIAQHNFNNMERVKSVVDKSEDPFYHIKSLNPVLSENDQEFIVKVALPEHEAKNLFYSGEGQVLKLNLSRRFQEKVNQPEENRTTRTNSFQTIIEQVAIPGAFDSKRISREYKDGIVTIKAPKAGAVTLKA